ncbi:hypothetical protein ACN267_28345 [Micromonospora sp. WMMD734]|uniref:Uncharacterized protein n=1 Tax=Micromonospora humidisoli TaxID=2807622 RepID=A0ABS2JA05_9ACTN|nr:MULTISPECIES: hypothetical protein [Micromonospora]MBM7082381.1 hypothetical protein [Micromonospora humidisoli]
MVGTTTERRRPGPASRGGRHRAAAPVLRESPGHQQNGVEEAEPTT